MMDPLSIARHLPKTPMHPGSNASSLVATKHCSSFPVNAPLVAGVEKVVFRICVLW